MKIPTKGTQKSKMHRREFIYQSIVVFRSAKNGLIQTGIWSCKIEEFEDNKRVTHFIFIQDSSKMSNTKQWVWTLVMIVQLVNKHEKIVKLNKNDLKHYLIDTEK